MHLIAKRALPLLLGGVEREYGLVYPLPEGKDDSFYWYLTSYLAGGLEDELMKRGQLVRHLFEAGDGFEGYMLDDGGCVSCEGPNVFEISSPETYDAREALAYLDDHRDLLARVLGRCPRLPARSLLSEGPSVLPGFGPRRQGAFELAFHLNFAAELTREQGLELCTMIAVLVPLLGCGGLTPRGFSCSPRGFAVRRSLRAHGGAWRRDEMISYARDRAFEPGEDDPREGHHVHISCLDSPLTRRTAAFLFASCQLLTALVLYGQGPLRGRRLARPERDHVAWSGCDFAHRCRLQGGAAADMRDLQEAMRAGLEEVGCNFALKPQQEMALEAILAGLRALRREDEEELSQCFDGYLKKKIYLALLANEGVSLSFFNRVAMPAAWRASRLCSGLPELVSLSPREAYRLVKECDLDGDRRKLLTLLGRNRLSPRDIPSLAGLVQRMLTLEIRLQQVYPHPSPLAEHEGELWNAYLEACKEPPERSSPTRAGMRGKLVEILGGRLGYRCRADWSTVCVFFPHRMVGVFSLPDPHRPQAFFRWVDVPLREEYVPDGEFLFPDLDFERSLLFHEDDDYEELADHLFPHLPDGHPLLKAIRFGVPEEQMPLFDGDRMEECGFSPGLPPQVSKGQLRLF